MSYDIDASPPSTLIRTIEAFPSLQRLGLHPWYAELNIHHRDGKVTCYSQIVLFIRPDGHWVEESAELTRKNPSYLVAQKVYEARSFVSRGMCHDVSASLLPEASPPQKECAFRMDLSCTVSVRGCYLPCQISPLAWLDSVREAQSRGFDLPEGVNDPRCPAVTEIR